jgi:nucleoside-diphosphate-sugar epimerase
VRILVTGATGRLGRETCRLLIEHGETVIATDSGRYADVPCKLHYADLLDRVAVYPLVDGCDAVVHLANHSAMFRNLPPARLYLENVTMNAHVFQAAQETGVPRVVFASTIQVTNGKRYGPEAVPLPSSLSCLPVDGDHPAAPDNHYALSKQAGEDFLRFLGEMEPSRSWTAIRFPAMTRGSWNAAAGGRPHAVEVGWVDEFFSYLDFRDAAALVHAVVKAARPGYACLFPTAADNRVGWTAEELARVFCPGVPLRKPLAGRRTLADLDVLAERYGWKPQHNYDLPRAAVEGVPGP